MDFITKLFARCMALAVVCMPYYGIAALNKSVQVQDNVQGVHIDFEASTVNAFKAQVDDANGSSGTIKLMRKRTVRNKTRGFFKTIASFILGYAALASLFYVAALIIVPFVVWVVFECFLLILIPHTVAPLVFPSLIVPGLIALSLCSLTMAMTSSAYNDIAGRDEFVAVNPDEYEILYVEEEV